MICRDAIESGLLCPKHAKAVADGLAIAAGRIDTAKLKTEAEARFEAQKAKPGQP
jgi:hypothetical protein